MKYIKKHIYKYSVFDPPLYKKRYRYKSNKSLLKKLIQTKKVRAQIIKLKQDINKPDFGRN